MARSGTKRSSRTVTVYGTFVFTLRVISFPFLLRTCCVTVLLRYFVTRTTCRPADRPVASENCMMPLGPAGLSALGFPKLSRYEMADSVAAGKPLALAAESKTFRSFVILSAPASASGSRMTLKVMESIMRCVRARRTLDVMLARSTPMPDSRCSGAKYSGRKHQAVDTKPTRPRIPKQRSRVNLTLCLFYGVPRTAYRVRRAAYCVVDLRGRNRARLGFHPLGGDGPVACALSVSCSHSCEHLCRGARTRSHECERCTHECMRHNAVRSTIPQIATVSVRPFACFSRPSPPRF